MDKVATIGLDIAKLVFQVHGVAADGEVLIRRRLTRARMLPFFEAATVPRRHRGLQQLALLGVRVNCARPRRKADSGAVHEALRQARKKDAADAESICEAVTRRTPGLASRSAPRHAGSFETSLPPSRSCESPLSETRDRDRLAPELARRRARAAAGARAPTSCDRPRPGRYCGKADRAWRGWRGRSHRHCPSDALRRGADPQRVARAGGCPGASKTQHARPRHGRGKRRG